MAAAVHNGYSNNNSQEAYRPGMTELSFFDREYYLWMQETFGAVTEGKLRAELPNLYTVREEYEMHLKDDYLLQKHKRLNELRDALSSSSAESVEDMSAD